MKFLYLTLSVIFCTQINCQITGQEQIRITNSNSNNFETIEEKVIEQADTISNELELSNKVKTKNIEFKEKKSAEKPSLIENKNIEGVSTLPSSTKITVEKPQSIVKQSKSEDLEYIEISTESLKIQDKSLDDDVKNAKDLDIPTINVEGNLKQGQKQLGTSFFKTKVAANSQSTQRSPTYQQQTEMQNVVNQYKKTAPNSFEYHFYKYVAGNYNVGLIEDLNEAFKLNPKNVDVQIQYAAYNFIKNDHENLKQNLDFLLENKKIEKELLIYAKHLLESVPTSGILLTHGFDDTYSALYVQNNLNIRPDVQLISMDFMQSEYYRNSLKSIGFSFPIFLNIDVNFFKSFCELNKTKNLQISMTFPKPYLQEIESNISVLGLTLIYGENPINLAERNETYFNEMENSKMIANFSTVKMKKLSSNYLPLLLSLKKEYEIQENKAKVLEMNKLIDKIKFQAGLINMK